MVGRRDTPQKPKTKKTIPATTTTTSSAAKISKKPKAEAVSDEVINDATMSDSDSFDVSLISQMHKKPISNKPEPEPETDSDEDQVLQDSDEEGEEEIEIENSNGHLNGNGNGKVSDKKKQKGKGKEIEKSESALYKLPMRRISRIVKSENPDMRITHEATFLINKATEKFLELFTKEAYACAFLERKNQVAYSHLSTVVAKRRRFDFLSDFVPEQVKAEDALAALSMNEK